MERAARILRLIAIGFIATLFMTHVLALLLILFQIFYGSEPAWPNYWFAFFLLDFPFSIVAYAIEWLMSFVPIKRISIFTGTFDKANSIPNFITPFIVYGVFGTLWWLWVLKKIRGIKDWS